MVAAEFGWARLIVNDKNRGFGAGANTGIESASGDVVLLLNPDTWVGPTTKDAIARFFETHPLAGVMGCGLFDPDGLPLISARRFYNWRTLAMRRIAPVSKSVQRFELLDHSFERPERVDWVAGSGMAINKKIFNAIGGFDERFFLYFEDVDLCSRIWLAGYEVWHDRSAPVFHIESRASARSLRPLVWHLKSWLYFEKKWLSLSKPSFGEPDSASEISSNSRLDSGPPGCTPLRPRRSGPGAIRVAIDANVLLNSPTGVGRSLESLVKAFANHEEIDPLLLAVSLRKTGRVHRFRTLARTRAIRLPARPMQKVWLTLNAPDIRWLAGKIDVFHGPNYFIPPASKAATVLTVHDIGFVRYPQFHTKKQRELANTLPRLLKRADRIITVSEFTRNEVAEWAGISLSAIDVIPHGVRRLPSEAPRPEGLPDEYLLYAGTLESRKGAEILLRAYGIAIALDSAVPPLVIAGEEGLGAANAIEEAQLSEDRLIRFGRVDDSELAQLLRGASLFVFPSVYEGFGMPPLEAMSEGTAVLATATSSLPEVLGDAAMLVEPDAEAVAVAIITLLEDSELRSKFVLKGKRRVAKFTWDQSAKLTIDSYRKAIENHRNYAR